MRRRWLVPASLVAACVAAVILWQATSSGADGPDDKGPPAKKEVDQLLPIRRVVLFNTGVGYFQREGEVDGDRRVELSFPAGDVNDLLKSLILQDHGGGHVSAVHYDSHDPLEKTLRSFAIDLSGNPTFGQILNQARGEKVEVTLRPEKEGGPKVKLVGTVVGMETQHKSADKGEAELLNLTTADGLQTVPLNRAVAVRFLNPTLEREFQRALRVLASSHDLQKKTLSLGFQGAGKRPVRVGYVVERPIWKTTYRLRVEAGGKVFLQAWALVENPSDDDWNDVQMVLVSGRPISFQMNLYEPLYIPRPFVEPDLFASLRPPVYGGAMNQPGDPEAPAQPKAAGMIGMPQVPMQGQGFGVLGGFAGMFGAQGGQFQGGQFQGGFQGFGSNRYQQPTAQPQQPANVKLTYEELQARRRALREAKEKAKEVGKALTAMNFQEGVASVVSAEELGDYHQFVLDQRTTLPRQKSAMLPIMNETIQGAKVSIFNAAVHAKHPLLGLRLKNTSGQPLTQGPITVYEGHTYAGDTRVLDLQPGEERLLSYALDQGTEVVTRRTQTAGPELTFKLGEDRLAANYKVRHTTTYAARNRSTHDRSLVIEHPLTAAYKLLEPAKGAEKTREHYRFRVDVPAGKTVKLEVVEEEDRSHASEFKKQHGLTHAVRDHVNVTTDVKAHGPKLTAVRIERGAATVTTLARESKTYAVQNLSSQEVVATVDHLIRTGWRVAEGQEGKEADGVFRFKLTVPGGKTVSRTVTEERSVQEGPTPLAKVTERSILAWLVDPAVGADVKAALRKLQGLGTKLLDQRGREAALVTQLQTIEGDQTRLRENLRIIPPTSEHYKKFLEKFVAQETEIETLQRQAREVRATVQTQAREYEDFIAKLNAE